MAWHLKTCPCLSTGLPKMFCPRRDYRTPTTNEINIEFLYQMKARQKIGLTGIMGNPR